MVDKAVQAASAVQAAVIPPDLHMFHGVDILLAGRSRAPVAPVHDPSPRLLLTASALRPRSRRRHQPFHQRPLPIRQV